uniref:Homocysteine-responsive endoplasmic reticulum-resident ubiquitin-like domain member 2 protein n=1 Tax=Mola mola TaxID=94237 RepID=A0A3Q3WWN7_MOLML
MDQGVVDNPVTLVIRAPNQKYNDQTINCYQNWTVEKLKAHLSDVYPSKPSSKDQRLVYSGKLLLDHFTLKDVLRKQDEYHMLHLVCASRTPPSSPKPPHRHSNKPQEISVDSNSPSTGQQRESATGVSSDGLRQRTGPFPDHHMYLQFMQSWNQYSSQSAPPTNTTPAYYNPMSLMWWQQLYARQYYMHYQLLAASSQHVRPDLLSAQPNLPDAQSQRPRAARANLEVQLNAQGGEILNEEELNRDWLDWVYTFSRAAILLSIVYFYSSFSRFVMVMVAMLVLYLHQAGWFPFNLENELQLPGDQANPDAAEGEPQNHELQEMEGLMDDGGSDDDGEGGEEGADDPNSVPQAGFLSSTWSFIVTFFMSLIPEGPQNAAN